MKQYRHKAVVDAIQWDGNNFDELKRIFDTRILRLNDNELQFEATGIAWHMNISDWIISVNGTEMVVENDTFAKDFEFIEPDTTTVAGALLQGEHVPGGGGAASLIKEPHDLDRADDDGMIVRGEN